MSIIKSQQQKIIQTKIGLQNIDDETRKQDLQELCNPDSVNLQQLKENILNFTSVLLKKAILSESRFLQIQNTISKYNNSRKGLTEEQNANLLKWELIYQLFSHVITLFTQNKQQLLNEDEDLLECLNSLKGRERSFNEIKILSFDKIQNVNYKSLLKYVSFQIIICVLQLRLQIITIVNEEKEQKNLKLHLHSQITAQKMFYFLDVGEILERNYLWHELQLQFTKQLTLKQNISLSLVSNKVLLKYLYLGLIIESLEFQSLNSGLRFAGQLLQLIFHQIESGKSSSHTERQDLLLISHLNKIIYFLRMLKKNVQDNLMTEQSFLNSQNFPPQKSRRSMLGKGLNSVNKIQHTMNNNLSSHQSIQTNSHLDEQNIFLNLLEEKVEKILRKFTNKYKQLTQELNMVDASYDELNKILVEKMSLIYGSEHFSTYSLHSFKKLKLISFNEDEKKFIFYIIELKLKNIFKSLSINYEQLFSTAKAIFIQTQLNQKIQNKLKSQQNKLLKIQLFNQFNQNLIDNQKNIKKIKSLTKFNQKINTKSQSQQSKKPTQLNKNIYLPTLKPKINLQIENRLKLKSLKQPLINELKDESFFMTHQDIKPQKTKEKTTIYNQNIKTGPKIKSKNNILISSYSNEYLIKQKKSISLPSKVKISTNYDIKSRFDRISFYQSTKNSVINRKFSYEMITCKRKKNQGQEHILWKDLPIKINQNLTKLQSPQTKILTPLLKTNELKRNSQAFKSFKRNSKHKQSLILQSSIQMRKLTLNQKDNQSKKSHHQCSSKRKQSASIQSIKNTEINQQNIFVKSINMILESYKNLSKKNQPRTSLKIDRKTIFEKEKRHSYQDKQAINQSEEVNMSTLKFQDASQTLTSLEIYLRGCLVNQRYKGIVQSKYPFYLQLQLVNSYIQSNVALVFNLMIVKVKRHDMIKRVLTSGLQNYWNTFRYFLQVNDHMIIIDIEERFLFEQKNVTLREYIMREIQKRSKFFLEKMFIKGFQYNMVGNLGGNIEHYTVKMIVLDYQCEKKYKQQQQDQQQRILKIISQNQRPIEKYPFLEKYYQNANATKLIGIKPQKNTVNRVQLYITKQFTLKNQLKPIHQFVKTLLLDPLNQYIIDWAAGVAPTTEEIYEEMDKTIKIYPKRERKNYHIYFLNRNYQKHSKFKQIIKRIQCKYPRDSIRKSDYHENILNQYEKDFIESVEVLQFMCKNLIFNKKYVIFNIKILRVAEKETTFKDYLMIEQKNSNFGNHKRIFFVFPLILQHRFHMQPILEDKNRKRNIEKTKYKQLIQQINKEVCLKNLSKFLINKKMIQIGNWSDTMFNKLLLMHPYVKMIKKVVVENQGNIGQQNNSNKKQQFIKSKPISKNAHESQIPRKIHIYATIKVFIIGENNLVIGVVQISGQSFFFHCTFEYLEKKMVKVKFKTLSRIGFGKGQTQVSIRDFRMSSASGLDSQNIDQKMKEKVIIPRKLSIKKLLIEDEQQKTESKKNARQSFRSSFKSSYGSIRKEDNIMPGEQKMIEFKQKFKLLFKYGCDLVIKANSNVEGQKHQSRMTTDNYQSKYSLTVSIEGDPIKVTQCKYYWWDVVPETGQECVNFRLSDDSLMLVKLSFNGNFYIRKSNKIKIHYFQNYLKLVQQKRFKYKGAGMSSMIRNQDKLIYYESYKIFVQNLQRYYFVFSSDCLLSQIRLDHNKHNGYQVNVMGMEVEMEMDDVRESQRQRKGQQNQGINFQLHTYELSNVHIPHMEMNKKILSNLHFKKRIRSILDYQMQYFLRNH